METQEINKTTEQSADTKARVHALASAISAAFPPISPSTRGEVNRHTNDMGFEGAWDEIQELLSGVDHQDDQRIRIGLIVGEGGCPSVFAELLDNVDILLFTDYDQRVLDWVKHTVDTLEKSKTVDVYESRVYNKRNHLLAAGGTNPGSISYVEEMDSIGKYHLLDSPQRYFKSRQALLQAKADGKEIVYVPMDLRDAQKGEQLGSILGSDSTIVYANLTNVAFHVVVNAIEGNKSFSLSEATQGFRDTFKALPFGEKSILQYSVIEERRELPKTRFSVGVDAYLSDSIRMPQA